MSDTTTPSSDQLESHQAAESSPTSLEIVEALVTTAHAVHRYSGTWLMRYQPPPIKLSGSRLRVLSVVADATSLRMRDLAAQLGVAARTVTDLVDGLERDGLLVRRPDPHDRRATLIELSADMRTLWEQVNILHHQISDTVMAPLTAAERQQLLDLLNRLKTGPIREAITLCPWLDDA